MICTSIQHKTYSEILAILQQSQIEMAEIRLDLCELTDNEISELFSLSDTPLIATCRGANRAAEHKLKIAIEAGARFADLEIEAPAQMSKNFQKLCRNNGTEIIRSYHDFDGTPSDEVLQMALARCFRYGADIAKVVTYCNMAEDAKRLESLYSIVLEDVATLQGCLVAFGMGELASTTRLDCLKRGAPFTYAALDETDTTAPGQLPVTQMYTQLYGERFSYRAQALTMPASKSFAQRAILAAALAEGTSHLSGYSPCGDTLSAIELARKLGAQVDVDNDTLIITGIGASTQRSTLSLQELNVGESGLLARLTIPILSAINGADFRITGRGTLERRPLDSASDIMAAFGVLLSSDSRPIRVPIKVRGQLIAGQADIPGSGGSQLISGLLMALPLCGTDSSLFVNEPKSIPYMYMTLDVLRHFGIKTRSEMEGDAELLEAQDWSACSGIRFNIKGSQSYRAADIAIEGDWSAAANFLVAGAVFGSAEIFGLDMQSLQADLTIVDILVEAGAIVSQVEDGSVCVRKAPLEAFVQDLNNAPDLFPICALLAVFCAGETRLDGVGRLSTKESDRAEAIRSTLTEMGVEVRIEGDSMFICGESLAARIMGGRLLRGGSYSSQHDHRMLMMLKVAELGADGPIVIDDEECVAKSYPDFCL